MGESALVVITALAAVGSGLVAGVFFAFSTFVMRALSRLPAAHGIAAMQAINVVVLNPLFLGVFFGTAALGLGLAVHTAWAWDLDGRAGLARGIGGLLYVVGTFGVTVACNVPRNNALAALNPAATSARETWERYVREWTRWNHVRTAASAGALIAFLSALRS